MRVLVLGGNRYIGMRLLFELAQQGHEVSVANSHLAEMPEGTRRLHVDRTVPGALTEVLGPHRDDFDVVFDNTAYRISDVDPLVELFRGRVQHYVFTSSVAVYRRSFVQPVRDTIRPTPTRARRTASGRCRSRTTSAVSTRPMASRPRACASRTRSGLAPRSAPASP